MLPMYRYAIVIKDSISVAFGVLSCPCSLNPEPNKQQRYYNSCYLCVKRNFALIHLRQNLAPVSISATVV